MCGDQKFFTCVNSEHKRNHYLADGKKVTTTGIGEDFVQCITNDGKNHKIQLNEVLFVHICTET